MATLVFEDRGWVVSTTAWTAASKKKGQVSICYQWGSDGFNWIDIASNVARVTLEMDMADFVKRIAKGGVVDLRR